MSIKSSLKSYLKSALYGLKARKDYQGARIYFREKTASYLRYLDSHNQLKPLPQAHAKQVVEYWTPLLSLSLSLSLVASREIAYKSA